jgi:uncharacterized protein RhaS with RHS repeats
VLGRYIEADPLGQEGGPNAYVYAANNPLFEYDPTGEILPAAAAYGRCIVQCMALDALLDPCFDFGDSAKNCALECLNPFRWFGGGLGGKVSGLAGKAGKGSKNKKKLDKMKKKQEERKHKKPRKSTKDKHTKPRPGRANDKKRQHDSWIQK